MTGYELFRKRIAPVLFLGMVGLIAYDAWKKDPHAGITGTVVIELGEAEPRVRELEAELVVRGESISTFRRVARPGTLIGDCRFQARMPAPDGELRIVIDLGDARRRLSRAIHVEDGATVRIDLASALALPAR
ncbi:MAG TPA: hypothetical protein VNO30_26380 [Kofleriaceae bacterium]|nr:hypothetical protein [Kofleriaceae bacterium]